MSLVFNWSDGSFSSPINVGWDVVSVNLSWVVCSFFQQLFGVQGSEFVVGQVSELVGSESEGKSVLLGVEFLDLHVVVLEGLEFHGDFGVFVGFSIGLHPLQPFSVDFRS